VASQPQPMTETTTTETTPEITSDGAQATTDVAEAKTMDTDSGVNFSERYAEILSTINSTLDQVDWSQMGRIGKAVGVLVVVIVAQILIKGVLDTINLLPVVPGLLELLGLVVVGQWSWANLTTGEKRAAVVSKLQNFRREYLG
jgi:hypothetical protein